MTALLESLVAEWRSCGGEKCRRRRCKRCDRFRNWCRANNKEVVR